MTNSKTLGFLILILLVAGCGKPVGNSLLQSSNSVCTGFDCSTNDTTGDVDVLKITADQSILSAPTDGGDVIGIQGSCVDLNRKNNRILVEVFAGVDETVTPYISNDIGVNCQSTTNTVTAGIEPLDLITTPSNVVVGPSSPYTFQVTGGTAPYSAANYSGTAGAIVAGVNSFTFTSPVTDGISVIKVTDSSASPLSFYTVVYTQTGVGVAVPSASTNQCFWVTKGVGLIETASPSNKIYPQCHDGRFGFSVKVGKAQSYVARFKLRTLDGVISDSVWSEVRIDRALQTPIIRTVSFDQTTVSLNIKSEASRFNYGILHTLSRTYTDILSASAGLTNIFTNEITASVVAGLSVFDRTDTNVIEGVTYNYTLTNTDISVASPALVTAVSPVMSLSVPKPSMAANGVPTAATCYFALTPPIGHGSYEWGRSLIHGWTGTNSDNNTLGLNGYVSATCGVTTACTEAGLVAGKTYWFAIRAFGFGQIGKWSSEVSCVVP